jgi:hypothetical protein
MDTNMPSESLLNTLAQGQFMQPVIWNDRFFEVETDIGLEYVEQALIGKTLHPSKSDLSDYIEGCEVISCNAVDGWGAYLSAPGYMDRTELCVFASEQDAINYLIEYYSE